MQHIDIFRQMVGIEGQHQCAISITGKRSASKQKQAIVEMFLCDRTPIPLPPDSPAQIDAAQQRSQFLDGDLKTSRAGFPGGDRVIARF